MSAIGQLTQQQLQQDLQNELTISNQLLHLISIELQKIKQFTCAGEEFEASIQQNASLILNLAKLRKIDIENLPPMQRKNIDLNNHTHQNISYEQHDSFRDTSDMEESQ